MEKYEDIIAGRNAVSELIKSGRPLDTVYITSGEKVGSINKIIAMAKQNGAVIKQVDERKLDFMANGVSHQGIVCVVAAAEYQSIDDILAIATEREESPFIIIADDIEDPHNLGALIRTAEASGAHGIIIPKRHSASLTGAVYKASAGALAHLAVARVSNIAQSIDELKKKNVWIYAADVDGEPWCSIQYDGAVGLVIGSEGKGVSRLVKQKADFIVSLPMRGKVNSLNASVAGGILMYEVVRSQIEAGRK